MRRVLFSTLSIGLLLADFPRGVLAAPPCGTILATYRDVPAISNGDDQATEESCASAGPYGLRYQCVEYVRRFYSQALHVDTSTWTYNGAAFYTNAAKLGLVTYTNSQSPSPPTPDDIIVFKAKRDPYGHVAIVTNVTGGSVTCIEQNWSKTGITTLELTQQNGLYSLVRPGSAYVVLGWLRLPPKTLLQKDIWTTSVYSYAPQGGGPGGGLDSEELVVGGWGDLYYSLIQFDLSNRPRHARTVHLELFCFTQRGIGTTAIYVDRITGQWDWQTQGTGSDHQRLWWADRPPAEQLTSISQPQPAPTVGQWFVIDITDLYNKWQDGTYPNFGVQLRPAPGGDNRWAEFYSFDYADQPLFRPRLVIDTGSTTGEF